jgi:hypothetical protein
MQARLGVVTSHFEATPTPIQRDTNHTPSIAQASKQLIDEPASHTTRAA